MTSNAFAAAKAGPRLAGTAWPASVFRGSVLASPQKENGFTPIANELMDALCRTRIPGEARQVLDVILRKTYGWNKKEDAISLSQFVESTSINKGHVCRSINTLLKMNLITKKGNVEALFTKKGNVDLVRYSFNKDFETWHTLPKKATSKTTLPKKAKDVTQKGNHTLPNWGHTKERIKDTITKDTYFCAFWDSYPKKKNKGKAIDAWKKIKEPATTLNAILIALEWQKNTDQWMKENGQFIPYPASYLNARAWEDEADGNKANGGINDNLFLRTVREENERSARKRLDGGSKPVQRHRDSKGGTPGNGGVSTDADSPGCNPADADKPNG